TLFQLGVRNSIPTVRNSIPICAHHISKFAIPIYHTCMARCRVSISMYGYVCVPGFKGRKQ
ncbi:hypothetical protein HID58_014193, partial [Brassica napus]